MKTEGEQRRTERGRRRESERERERGEGEAHFLLRTQGRKFMNGSHLSSCSKCKQHTWTKKNELSALSETLRRGLFFFFLPFPDTKKKQKQ